MSSKKAARENKKVKIKDNQSTKLLMLQQFTLWGLAVLLFLPPYFRGLFFPYEQAMALLFTAVLFWLVWLWKWANQDYRFLDQPLDYMVLALPVIYLFAAFQAVNYGLAVNELVKLTLYFMVYWLVSRAIRNQKDFSIILHALYLSALGVALAGLMAATEIISIHDAFVNRRIFSTYQYPNALASFLGATTYIGLYFWASCGTENNNARWSINSLKPYLYTAATFIIFAVLLGTRSNGGLAVFALMLLLFAIGYPKSRWPVLLHYLMFSIPAIFSIWLFIQSVEAQRMWQAWLWLLLGLAISLCLQWLYQKFAARGLLHWLSANRRALLVAVLLAAFACCIAAGVYISGHSESVQSLLKELRLRNATERFAFYKDALRMFSERPILGWGGGGWEEAYQAYQSYFYKSKQVHSYFFQVLVEAGILGLLAALGIWFAFLHSAIKVYRRSKENLDLRLQVWTVTIAACTIGLHSVIDFDLALSALAIVLWSLFGLGRVLNSQDEVAGELKKTRSAGGLRFGSLAVVTVIAVAIVVLTGCLIKANNCSINAVSKLQQQNIKKATAMMEEAIAYNPLSPDYHFVYAGILQRQGDVEEAIAHTQRAIALGQYSAESYAQLTNLYHSAKRSDGEIIAAAEKTLTLAPFESNWYDFLARAYYYVGYNNIIAGDNSNAILYLQKTTGVSGLIEAKMATLSETKKRLWQDAPLLTPGPVVWLFTGKAQYLLGDFGTAEASLKQALIDDTTKPEAALFLALAYDKLGDERRKQQMLEQVNQLAPDLMKSYESLYNKSIK